MGKKKILRGETPIINTGAFKSVAPLPSSEQAITQVKALTATEQPQEAIRKGRPTKETTPDRVRYNTTLSKACIKFLRLQAAESEATPADVLEQAILYYKDYKDSLK